MYRSLRYEDLSMDPANYVKSLFDFLGLPVTDSVTKFLETHTSVDIGGVSSTFRNSKAAPFHWKQDLTFAEVLIKRWNYFKLIAIITIYTVV